MEIQHSTFFKKNLKDFHLQPNPILLPLTDVVALKSYVLHPEWEWWSGRIWKLSPRHPDPQWVILDMCQQFHLWQREWAKRLLPKRIESSMCHPLCSLPAPFLPLLAQFFTLQQVLLALMVLVAPSGPVMCVIDQAAFITVAFSTKFRQGTACPCLGLN